MTAKLGAPALLVSIVSAELLPMAHRCAVVWRLENLGPGQVEIEESWLPHSQFQADRQAFVPPLPVSVGVLHRREVQVGLQPGSLVENAFLILRVRHSGVAWRIFVRMKVEAALGGSVRPLVEAITASSSHADA